MFIAALCTIAKTWNQPECPSMIDWTKKMWYIYTVEYYAVIKNDELSHWHRQSCLVTHYHIDSQNNVALHVFFKGGLHLLVTHHHCVNAVCPYLTQSSMMEGSLVRFWENH